MKELKKALCGYLQLETMHFAGGGTEAAVTADDIVDTVRDAGWLPPDEVRNESADLQLAAMALVKALQGRLVTQPNPPLGPLVDRLAVVVGPYFYKTAQAQHDERTAEDAKALKGGPIRGPLGW